MEPELAVERDAASIVRLRDEAARWLQDRGINQWAPGELGVDTVREQILAGQWYVLRKPHPLAAVRLLSEDAAVWGEQPPDSLYVHGLVVSRTQEGNGMGAELLAWAEQEAVKAGKDRLRLDCVEENARLRDYYEALGFRCVGRKDFNSPWRPVALYEKALPIPPPSEPRIGRAAG